jgi:hypothetical protein
MNHCTYTNELFYVERSWIYLQVSLDPLFSFLAEHFNIAVVQNFEVMLGQMLNHFV